MILKGTIYSMASLITFNFLCWAFGYDFSFAPGEEFGYYCLFSILFPALSFMWAKEYG